MGEGLFRSGGLYERRIEQWRHCGGVIEGEYLVEFFSRGICPGGPLERSERGHEAEL